MDENNWDQKKFGPKSVRLEKFDEKKILSPKHFNLKFLVSKNWVLKILRVKKLHVKKRFWSKKCLVQKNFGPKNF